MTEPVNELLWNRDACPFHGKVKCEKCRCQVCKRGILLEDALGDFCSRRYAQRSPCPAHKVQLPDLRHRGGKPWEGE